MPDSLSLEGKIHFYYDQSFDDIKKEVFANWILEYLNQDDPPRQTREHIEDFFQKKLGYVVQTSERTRRLFEASIEEVVRRNWVRVEQIPLDKQSEYIYSSTSEGKQRLFNLVRQRKELLDNCYGEFVTQLYRDLFRQRPAERIEQNQSLDNIDDTREPLIEGYLEMSGQERIDKVEAKFSSVGTLRKAFDNYLTKVSKNVAETLIRSGLRQSFLSPDRQQLIIERDELQDLFSLKTIENRDDAKKFERALEHLTKRLYELNHSNTPYLQYWFYLRAYEVLFEKMWPDEDVQEHLIQYLNCIYVYLDTNVLISALSKSDLLHYRSRQILNFLLKNHVKVFWLPITERELESHLELSKGLVQMLERRPAIEVYEVLELSKAPSFVKSYFASSWRSWQQFSDEVHENYDRIKSKSLSAQIGQMLLRNVEFTQSRDKFTEAFQKTLKSNDPRRHPAILRHDALILSTIYTLRKMMPEEFVSKECDSARRADKVSLGELFWIVSFDRKLSGISGLIHDAKTEKTAFPLTLLYETILLFLDPYVVSKALREGGGTRPTTPYLPLSSMKDLKNAINKAQEKSTILHSIADYIRQYNEQMENSFPFPTEIS